jgi:hypothetical protein
VVAWTSNSLSSITSISYNLKFSSHSPRTNRPFYSSKLSLKRHSRQPRVLGAKRTGRISRLALRQSEPLPCRQAHFSAAKCLIIDWVKILFIH